MARDVAEVETIAKRAVSLLRARIPVTEAYLFGSYMEGTAREDSDIDIAAFSPDADAMNFETKVELAVNIERQIEAPVELHLFGTKNLAEARPTNFFGYLLAHGKPLD
ncbi:MAG: nucleotidyltransferase domain-containing protein [Nitrospirae bacterium]|nr:nucleotidyltransferase domain-containing protein [Nitrospirota bacterium]